MLGLSEEGGEKMNTEIIIMLLVAPSLALVNRFQGFNTAVLCALAYIIIILLSW